MFPRPQVGQRLVRSPWRLDPLHELLAVAHLVPGLPLPPPVEASQVSASAVVSASGSSLCLHWLSEQRVHKAQLPPGVC